MSKNHINSLKAEQSSVERGQLRMTIQKQKIYDYLKSVKSHPTADDVYIAVRDDIPTISLGTVYRNLNMMADSGKILRFEVNKHLRFDADLSSHQHCVCRVCGMVTDCFEEDVSEYAMKRCCVKGFTPDDVNITFHGICNVCGGG